MNARVFKTKQAKYERKMSVEVIDPIDSGLKAELDDDTSSMHTESEDLNSPQVETNTENELSRCKQSFLSKSHVFVWVLSAYLFMICRFGNDELQFFL